MSVVLIKKSINIAIIAMGGQGGGVLSKWIIDLAEAQGFIAQYTSVPGVAQRTGATIYYIELFPKHLSEAEGKPPVLGLTPVPGDVDIVIASEMMEAGRALNRGFVNSKTTLIASDHRDYAIVEKQIMGDGRKNLESVRALAAKTAGRLICFDMDRAARASGSVISSVLFGALAGSGALPITRNHFEQTIRETKKAVETNLRGFESGFAAGETQSLEEKNPVSIAGRPAASPKVSALLSRLKTEFPGVTHHFVFEGLKKVTDYQGPAYANLYLDRLCEFLKLDENHGGREAQWRLTQQMARYLALAMAYEDTIRVADLKTRATRFQRFREEVRAEENQIVHVVEFMHPRWQEICEILPAAIGRYFLESGFWRNLFAPLFSKGRRVKTTGLRGFLLLYIFGGLRPIRPASLRFKKETLRIEAWLEEVRYAMALDYDLACEVAGMQRLIKGYGDTHERGLRNAAAIMNAYRDFSARPDAAELLKKLKDAALKDEEGVALSDALQTLTLPMAAE